MRKQSYSIDNASENAGRKIKSRMNQARSARPYIPLKTGHVTANVAVNKAYILGILSAPENTLLKFIN